MPGTSLLPAALQAAEQLTLFSLDPADLSVNWITERVRDTGFTPEDFLRPGFWQSRVHADDRPSIERARATLLERGTAAVEYRFEHADGSFHWYFCGALLERGDGGGAKQVLGSWLDISERIATERRLRESEARYRQIVEQISEGIVQLDGNGVVRFANQRLLDILGQPSSALLGRELPADALAPAARNGGRMDTQCHHKDGHALALSVLVAPANDGGSLLLIEDVTAQRAAERAQETLRTQLNQAQKMEALGRLTAGIVHDFNNLVSVTLMAADFALNQIDAAHPLHGLLTDIRDTGLRGAALCKQLLAFSRKQVLAPQVLDAGALVLELEPMLGRVLGRDIELSVRLGPGERLVRVDPVQLQQVLMNLVVNARDAMPDGGRLQLEVAEAHLDDVYLAHQPKATAGCYVVLSVSDTGAGMSEDTVAHIFEPFFTTKDADRGTGLGLSTSYGIVEQSGGFMRVYSELGKGSSFHVYLPCAQHAGAGMDTEPDDGPRGVETLLLVEDDAALRAAAARALQARGYEVLAAASETEALALGQARAGKVALLVCDMTIAGGPGAATAAALREQQPGLRVLFISGLAAASADARDDAPWLPPYADFLQKPFTATQLALRVRELLDRCDCDEASA